ncbi:MULTISPECIES: SAM-dependent methyltransferase [Streptomyces]|uniref:SAM-dependent methyltransferase n=1 Tax=Streptomyces TaxID=1883 RepID=UPI000C26543D|nr:MULTISPECIES: SAM-dependent methyltransferase [unclassified Streptomyces]NEE23902.1 SAM-dependent methyltransferase [Streptomyces sp. SID7982]NEE46201.1 SAM-dependent methyltransferase [Streptomyces sp. SID8455]MBL3805973.1 SAM-dependent methyltransferase [Streptomyces sp. BRB081]PJM83161.1 methyltransferase [Streptomyces sp. TSRI0384-2]RPK90747.1 S-adenosyl methyltransferase [Streptomyces sp. ADI98-12]
MNAPQPRPSDLATSRAHSARVYDYILGGKDHYPPDVEAGDAMCRHWPALPVHMLENRRFMHRAARHLAEDHGIRQFLDVGTGLPTSPNLHEVVQEVAPESHVVYVDNDPIVLAHARALLRSAPEGATAYVDADMHDPDAILGSPEFRELIDLDRPVGLLVIGILHFILPPDDRRLIQRLLDPLPSGSYLAMTIGTADFAPEEVNRVAQEYRQQGMPMELRDLATATSFFDGMDLLEPGVTQVHEWRPGPEQEGIEGRDIAMYGAVARKR